MEYGECYTGEQLRVENDEINYELRIDRKALARNNSNNKEYIRLVKKEIYQI